MEVVSTNLAKPQTVKWQGKEFTTGIFKYPVNHPLQLEKEDVRGDAVMDRNFHGGRDKACYLFSEDHYPYWKKKYPKLDWMLGMFGENLTVRDCNEKSIYIGDTYEIGTAIIQAAQPRQPCFKLGIRFNNQSIIKDFINQPFSGVYFRVIKEGEVKKGNRFKLVKRTENGISIAEVFSMLYKKQENNILINKALNEPLLSEDCKNNIKKRFNLFL